MKTTTAESNQMKKRVGASIGLCEMRYGMGLTGNITEDMIGEAMVAYPQEIQDKEYVSVLSTAIYISRIAVDRYPYLSKLDRRKLCIHIAERYYGLGKDKDSFNQRTPMEEFERYLKYLETIKARAVIDHIIQSEAEKGNKVMFHADLVKGEHSS